MSEYDSDKAKNQKHYKERVMIVVGMALDALTSHDGHDPHCEVCGFRVWVEEGVAYCQEGCPVRPLRAFPADLVG